ncbi:uncharacterized protein RAG0_00840 [Rhynchosporium agropyri]|uniref:Uncharacterized protein n=2 Tax=Rhynchosporium TaxID=38037 RepID=A0A1E1M971_RHYSE|nr:uncharacterized protein RAG0_00840 [Rhynchosporium agropyri]CZT45640.1 uncharacterized protein RSE6_05969 [Rhynchosporium secalis]
MYTYASEYTLVSNTWLSSGAAQVLRPEILVSGEDGEGCREMQYDFKIDCFAADLLAQPLVVTQHITI